jgi:hypothetical protein
MAKLKWDDFDDEELDAVEYDPDKDSGFTPYDGPIPPSNTILAGTVKKAWSTKSKAGKPMIKVLWEASGNEGDKKIYNGLPIWDYIVLSKEAVFKWKPFLAAFGLTAADVKGKTIVDTDDTDNANNPSIVKIGNKFKPGEAKVSVVTKKEKYNGDDQARAGKYMMPVDDDDAEDDDDVPF